MNWLKRKVEIHNKFITYVDYEEAWTAIDFIASLILHMCLGLVSVGIGVFYKSSTALVILGLIYAIIMIVWHFWHLLYY